MKTTKLAQTLFRPDEIKKLSQCKNNDELQKVLQELLEDPKYKGLPPLDPKTEAAMSMLSNMILDRAYEETEKYQKEKAEGKNPKLPWKK